MIAKRSQFEAWIDQEGRVVLPQGEVTHLGLKPGARLQASSGPGGLTLRIPITHLARVYIEPTNECNLHCRTCIRNVWNETLGRMERETFVRILDDLRGFSPIPDVVFGGFGEPLVHPDLLDMVEEVKAIGACVELVTNGTLMNGKVSKKLIRAGLDVIWVSMDGADPKSYEHIRSGAVLSEVLAHLTEFNQARWPTHLAKPELGIVFVAMKRNIEELPSMVRLSNRLGATRFLVTNLLPYTPDMGEEILYSRSLGDLLYTTQTFRMDLPKLDIDESTGKTMYHLMRSGYGLRIAGGSLSEANDRCPFIEKGAMAINWAGEVSPCLPLMYGHAHLFYDRERRSRPYRIGNIWDRDLKDLWSKPDYVAFRERVQRFDFSFCTTCGGCDLAYENEEDCFGNDFPTCGGCLWAQGIIQCP